MQDFVHQQYDEALFKSIVNMQKQQLECHRRWSSRRDSEVVDLDWSSEHDTTSSRFSYVVHSVKPDTNSS